MPLKGTYSSLSCVISSPNGMLWGNFEAGLEECFCSTHGRPSLPPRLLVGLHYLKYAYDMSDEEVFEEWLEDTYW